MVDTHPLREFRKQRGLTQAALGRELGVTGVTISRWESGLRWPNRRDLPRIAEMTGIGLAELLPPASDPTTPQPAEAVQS